MALGKRELHSHSFVLHTCLKFWIDFVFLLCFPTLFCSFQHTKLVRNYFNHFRFTKPQRLCVIIAQEFGCLCLYPFDSFLHCVTTGRVKVTCRKHHVASKHAHTHLPLFPNSSFQRYNTLSKFWIPAVIFDRVKIWPMWLPTLKQCNKVLFLNPHRRGCAVSSPTESCSRPLITALYESLSHRSENVLPWLGIFFSLPHGCSSEWGNIYCSIDLYGLQAGNNQMISQPIYSLKPLANSYTALFFFFLMF